MEGMATPWTYTGNLLNKGNGNVDDTVAGCLPLNMSAETTFTSFLYHFWKHVLNTGPNWTAAHAGRRFVWLTLSPPAVCSRSSSLSLFFYYYYRCSISALFHAPSTRAQPTASQWTLAKRILTPRRVKAQVFTQRSRWSSILFGQASKHTGWRLSNYPPAKMCVCHRSFVHSSFNLI